MTMISTASPQAAAAPSMAPGLPLPAAPVLALPAVPGQVTPAAAAPLFFAQFLGLEAVVGAELPSQADGADEGKHDAPATAGADSAPPATPAADMPAMAMLMMPPPLPPALPPQPTAPATGYAAASLEADLAIAARPTSATPVSGAPPAATAANAPAVSAAVAAAGSAAVAAAVSAAVAATVSAPAGALIGAAVAGADVAPASPRATGFAARLAAGAIALPPAAAAAPGAEAPPTVDAAPAKSVEAAPRTLAADAGAWAVAAPAPAAAPAPSAGGTVELEGAPQQWQQTLRDALGERLQTQVGRNSEHAVIRLDPPQLGRIEIAIRHSAGALQVTLSATHGDVLRQLHAIGDSVRQQLSQQSFTEVALVVTPAASRGAAAHAFGDGGGRGAEDQRRQQRDEAQPGRALSEAGQPSATFAMQPERNNS